MFSSFSQFPPHIQRGVALGAVLGAVLTVTMFTQVQWYHDLVVWSWTNPWMYAVGIPLGVVAAILTDKD